MRETLALVRAAWLSAASYRIGLVMSLLSLVAVVLPLYFIANALQPTMQATIAGEARQYFAFVLVGAVTFSLVTTCATALPSAVGEAIGRGTLEAILGTPARVAAVCAGFMGYGITWALIRAVIVLAIGVLLGAGIVWSRALAAIPILALTMAAYAGIGLVVAALIVSVRTAGPLSKGVLTASMFLGGVYYPARVIPSWIRDLSDLLPLTYGLRALRQIILRGDSLSAVAHDVLVLALLAMTLFALGVLCFASALRYAKRAGTLAQY